MIRRSPGDFVVVLLGGSILLASFVLAAAQSGGVNLLPQREVCWSRIVLGQPCPGCGLTRSFVATARGDLERAAAWNPTGPLLFAVLALLTTLHALRLGGAPLPWLGWADGIIAAGVAVALAFHAIRFGSGG